MNKMTAGPLASESTPNRFERIVVLDNPMCTQVEWAHEYLATLDDSEFVGDRRVTVSTEPASVDTKDKLVETVREGDLVVVVGGDKTVGDAADVVLGSNVPLLPVWAGNANDIAHMLNGTPGRHGLLDIIQNGNIVPLHPVRRQTTRPSGTRYTTTAANYVGFGLSGMISHRLNDQRHRHHPAYYRPSFRSRHENMIGVRSALNRPSFIFDWGPETPIRFSTAYQEGEVLLDLTIAAGHRMGKRDEVLPVRLEEQRLFVGRTEPGWIKAAAGIGRMALRRTRGQYLEGEEVLAVRLLTDTWTHTDGDAIRLPAQTTERI